MQKPANPFSAWTAALSLGLTFAAGPTVAAPPPTAGMQATASEHRIPRDSLVLPRVANSRWFLDPESAKAAASRQDLRGPNDLTYVVEYSTQVDLEERTEGAGAAPGRRVLTIQSFRLMANGLPLSRRATRAFFIGDDGRLLGIRTRGVPAEVETDQPARDIDKCIPIAVMNALDALRERYPDRKLGPDDLAIDLHGRSRPLTYSTRGRLAWAFTVQSTVPGIPFRRSYLVAARGSSPVVLERDDRIAFDVSGRVTAGVWEAPPAPAPANPNVGGDGAGTPVLRRGLPLKGLSVTLFDPSGAVRVAHTDADGRFRSAASPRSVRVDLTGPFCHVIDVTQSTYPAIFTAPRPPAPLTIELETDAAYVNAARSAFYYVNKAHDYVFQGGLAATPLVKLWRLPVFVNVLDPGVSQYVESSISLARAGGIYPNLAYDSTIYHEYGHGVDDEFGGMHSAGYSEGFGDALALLITGDPEILRLHPLKQRRNVRDVVLYPPKAILRGDPHDWGRSYSGFVWQLLSSLQKSLGQERGSVEASRLVLGAAAMDPSSIPQAVRYSLYIDSRDRGRHRDVIISAARDHWIPHPKDPDDLASTFVDDSGREVQVDEDPELDVP